MFGLFESKEAKLINTNTIIKSIVVIILFVIGWNLESRFLAWLCFSIGSIVIIYPFFMGRNKK